MLIIDTYAVGFAHHYDHGAAKPSLQLIELLTNYFRFAAKNLRVLCALCGKYTRFCYAQKKPACKYRPAQKHIAEM